MLTIDEIRAVIRQELAAANGGWMPVKQFIDMHDMSRATLNRKIRNGELEARGAGTTRQVRMKEV